MAVADPMPNDERISLSSPKIPRSALNVAVHSLAWWVLLIATVALTASAIIARATAHPTAPASSGISRVLGGHADQKLIASEYELTALPSSFGGFDMSSLPSSILLIIIGILAIAFMVVLVRLGIVLAIAYLVLRALPVVRAWLATWLDPHPTTGIMTLEGRAFSPDAVLQNRDVLHADLTPWIIIYGVLVIVAIIALWSVARGVRSAEE